MVGKVTSGSAALTRAPDAPTGASVVNGISYEVSEGTLYAGTSWKAMCTGNCVVGTDDPLLYPRKVGGTVTLASGTKALGATQGLWLFSTTKSQVMVTCNTPNTVTASVGLSAPVGSRTAGKIGTAAVTINAFKTDATTDTGNVSSVDWAVHNW